MLLGPPSLHPVLAVLLGQVGQLLGLGAALQGALQRPGTTVCPTPRIPYFLLCLVIHAFGESRKIGGQTCCMPRIW